MKSGKRGDPLIGEMDAFAAELLKGAKSDTTTSQAKIDVFRTITQWIGTKNRLVDDEGEDLDVIRAKLRGSPSETAGGTPRRRPDAFDGIGGSALAAIKRKLPRANAGDPAGDSNGAERPHPAADSSVGGVRPKPDDDF